MAQEPDHQAVAGAYPLDALLGLVGDHRTPASTAYVSHVLDACGVPPRMLRCTRLVDLVNTTDPKLVAAAFGMDPEGVMSYLADRVHDGLLPSDDNDGVVHSPELSGRR